MRKRFRVRTFRCSQLSVGCFPAHTSQIWCISTIFVRPGMSAASLAFASSMDSFALKRAFALSYKSSGVTWRYWYNLCLLHVRPSTGGIDESESSSLLLSSMSSSRLEDFTDTAESASAVNSFEPSDIGADPALSLPD